MGAWVFESHFCVPCDTPGRKTRLDLHSAGTQEVAAGCEDIHEDGEGRHQEEFHSRCDTIDPVLSRSTLTHDPL